MRHTFIGLHVDGPGELGLNAMLALGQIVLAVREAKAAAIDFNFFD